MSDYRHSVTIPLGLAAKYWKAVEYGTLTVLLFLKSTNPIFKIALALHVGLQTMLVLAYSPLVYYKSIGVQDEDSSSKGLMQKLTGFIPNLIKKVSMVALQVSLRILKALNIWDSKVNIQCLASVVTFFLIVFRKLIALMIFTYVTSEDDESTHKKAFALFTIFMAIQMKYILELNKDTQGDKAKKVQNSHEVSFWKTIKLLYLFEPQNLSSLNKKTISVSLGSVRSRLYTTGLGLSGLLIYYTYKYATEIVADDVFWVLGMKSYIVIDALFVTSFVFELSGLNLHFSNKEDTFV